MPASLNLSFNADTDQTGELLVEAQQGAFAGKGSAWFHFREIVYFGEQLNEHFPLPQGHSVSLVGGYWKSGASPPEIAEPLVALRVYPVGTTGTIGIGVLLADRQVEGQRQESRRKVELEILTDYQTIQTFGRHVAGLIQGENASVRLFENAA